MASKDGKEVSLSATIKPFTRIPAGKTLIEVDKLDKLMEDKKRATVIIQDTFLDQTLKELLGDLHFLRQDKEVKKLFEPSIGGPLVSLTHKARLAYALRLIDKTVLKDLEHIHNIRNKFAHSIKMNFADTEVVKSVGNLSTAKGLKVTVKNSYKIYKDATSKCVLYFIVVFKQEQFRQAALMMGKEKKE